MEKNAHTAFQQPPKTPETPGVTVRIPKLLTLQQAAGIAGVSPDTIARWCRRYGIGKQLHPKAPWRVDPLALSFVIAGDADGLRTYRSQSRGNA